MRNQIQNMDRKEYHQGRGGHWQVRTRQEEEELERSIRGEKQVECVM